MALPTALRASSDHRHGPVGQALVLQIYVLHPRELELDHPAGQEWGGFSPRSAAPAL